MKKIVLIVGAIILMMLSVTCIRKGFDCKDNYYSSDYFSSLNKNAYVGGDAYNYIINGTYFTGYMVLGGSAGIGAMILLCTGMLIGSRKSIQCSMDEAVDITDLKTDQE